MSETWNVIPSGASTSSYAALVDYPDEVVGLEFPAAMTGANISFTTAESRDGTFRAVYLADGTTLLSVPVALSKRVLIEPYKTVAFGKYVKLLSDGTEAADRTIKIITRAIT